MELLSDFMEAWRPAAAPQRLSFLTRNVLQSWMAESGVFSLFGDPSKQTHSSQPLVSQVGHQTFLSAA